MCKKNKRLISIFVYQKSVLIFDTSFSLLHNKLYTQIHNFNDYFVPKKNSFKL